MTSWKNSIPVQSWNNWKWQLAHRITNTEMLSEVLDLSEQEKTDITTCLKQFRMAITPYYASLIHPEDEKDPIRMQSVPSIQETLYCSDDLDDPLNEVGSSPVPNIVHRYPDRVLLLVTYVCSMYCRHCTRRRVVGEEDGTITESELEIALDYIRSHEEIRDVLISGGDPLTMNTLLPDSGQSPMWILSASARGFPWFCPCGSPKSSWSC